MAANKTADICPALHSSKRKREQVSYLVNDYFDDKFDLLGIPDSESDGEGTAGISDISGVYGRQRSIKPLVKKKSPPRSKRFQPFRFLDLSAELRNEIYELVLTEEDGITLVTKTSQYRRTVIRGIIVSEAGDMYYGKKRRPGGFQGWYGSRQGPTTKTTLGQANRKLSPNILAVSKQIREEGSSILYKQKLILEDMIALHAFLMQIGSYNQKLVTGLTIKGWSDTTGVAKGFNFAGLCALTPCTSLKSLFFDCSLGWYKSPAQLARQLFRDGHYFLEALVAVHGTIDAAIDVVRVCNWHFDRHSKHHSRKKSQKAEYDQEKEKAFEKELRSLLI